MIAADVDGDGWVDIYVANDGDPNQLWINKRGSARFEDEALIRGVALDRMGRTQGSMGIDLADVDGDGDEDLFITNLDNEGNTFYRNQGRGIFEDRTSEAGLFRLGLTGFGARFIDYDNDGWLDLVLVNGAVRQLTSQIRAGDADSATATQACSFTTNAGHASSDGDRQQAAMSVCRAAGGSRPGLPATSTTTATSIW